jgi:hypothetical protein
MSRLDSRLSTIAIGALLLMSVLVAIFPSSAFAQVSEPDSKYRFCGNMSTKNSDGDKIFSERRCYTTLAACNSDPDIFTPGTCTDQGPRGVIAKLAEYIKNPGKALTDLLDATIGKVLAGLAWVFFYFAGVFLNWMTFLLDYSIETAIMSGLLGNLLVVNIGWTVVRDACNMVYIFILLYAAIQTILGIASGGTKRTVAMVIVSAILINFSLFFTKVVIDAGNIIAKGFWDRMKITQGGVTGPSFASWAVLGGKFQTSLDPDAPANMAAAGKKEGFSNVERMLMFIGGGVVMFVMGYVFLAGAVMMVIRIVTLIFLMIFSPFAFLGLALPKLGYFDKWFSKLISATFSAPILVFLLYLITIVIQGADLYAISGARGDTGFGCAFGNVTPACYAIFMHYFVLVALILGALKITSDFSGGMGAKAGQIAKGAIALGGATGIAGAAFAGRRAARVTAGITGNEKVQQFARRIGGIRAEQAIKKADAYAQKAAMGSWDLRSAKVGRFKVGEAATAGLATVTGVNLAKPPIGATILGAQKNKLEEDAEKEKEKMDKVNGAIAAAKASGKKSLKEQEEMINHLLSDELKKDPAVQRKLKEFRDGYINDVFEEAKLKHKENLEMREAYIKSKIGNITERQKQAVMQVDPATGKRVPVLNAMGQQLYQDVDIPIMETAGMIARIDKMKEEHASNVYMQAKSLFPNDPAAQRSYIEENLGGTTTTKRVLTGYDAHGNPIYNLVTTRTRVADKPEHKRKIQKLDTEAQKRQSKQRVADMRELSRPGSTIPTPPGVPASSRDMFVASVMIEEMQKTPASEILDVFEPPELIKYADVLSRDQLRALGKSEDVDENTLRQIKEKLITRDPATGRKAYSGQGEWLDEFIDKNKDSNWATA